MKITGSKVHLDLDAHGRGHALLHPGEKSWELSLFLVSVDRPSTFAGAAPVPCYGFEEPHPESWPTEEEILDTVQAILLASSAPTGARSPS